MKCCERDINNERILCIFTRDLQKIRKKKICVVYLLTRSQAMIYRIDQLTLAFEIVAFIDRFFLSRTLSVRFVNAFAFSLNFSER